MTSLAAFDGWADDVIESGLGGANAPVHASHKVGCRVTRYPISILSYSISILTS
jgi:hypothetical protein